VENLVAKTAGELNLLDWRIGIEFDDPDPEDRDGCSAWTYVDSRYLTSYIHFTPYSKEMWDEGRLTSLSECVIHEVCHILLNPLHEFAKQAASPQTESQLTDILEQTTQRLTRIVIEHLPAKFFSV
jgi:hypothetical protein